MFEYHGWVNIRESTGDDDGELLHAMVDRIRELLAGVEDDAAMLDLRWMNGEPYLHFAGMRNHRNPRVIDLLQRVGRVAPGSFGLLYIWDDEDPGRENEFRVFRLVRGVVTEHSDTLLSPCMPTVEDELD
ncbi:immunity 7 family protein [Actinoallomurus vinaceus]|uniref:Immunity 7 family protein n=1 Tax=Actinoallomurus vinaceus TaxID=1080074 RepID=A0ABP8U414_9ACTN